MRLVILPEDSTVPHQWTMRKDWRQSLIGIFIRRSSLSQQTSMLLIIIVPTSLISHSGLSNLTLKKALTSPTTKTLQKPYHTNNQTQTKKTPSEPTTTPLPPPPPWDRDNQLPVTKTQLFTRKFHPTCDRLPGSARIALSSHLFFFPPLPNLIPIPLRPGPM